MSKTDKELTAEIAIAFIQSWHAKPSTSPLSSESVSAIISDIYKVISKLGN